MVKCNWCCVRFPTPETAVPECPACGRVFPSSPDPGVSPDLTDTVWCGFMEAALSGMLAHKYAADTTWNVLVGRAAQVADGAMAERAKRRAAK